MCDQEIISIFGGHTAMLGTDDDLFELLKRPAPACGRPDIMMRCGDKDILIEENREFIRRASEAGNWNVDYAETPGAGHTWEFWMDKLVEIFDFFSK